LGKIYNTEELEKERKQPYFRREFELAYSVGTGNVFTEQSIQAAEELGRRYTKSRTSFEGTQKKSRHRSRNAKRLQRLTEDILDVARIETESLMLRKSQFNLKDLVLNTITDYKSQIKKEDKDNKLGLVFTTTEDNNNDIFAYGDTGRITQVISNLLSNAIKFTAEGTITVKIEKRIDKNNQEEVVTVSIKDNGKGIDPTIRDKLFEKFATRSEKGMGLGLYLSRKIIEAHDGNIWAENNVDSKGATFSFSLQIT
jgi:two-component system sensor histidine kinase VicK